MAQDEGRPMNRRRFFREGFRELLRPLSRAVQPLENIAHQIGKLEPVVTPPKAPTVSRKPSLPLPMYWLRPPGVTSEQDLADKCSRCGLCVQSCPVQAIQLDSNGEQGGGLPYIDLNVSSCVVCDELACMNACPSGALQLLPREQIDMGTALVRQSMCLRTVGQECTICLDHCPIGPTALELVDGKIKVHEDGCTGCGRCEHECPTLPKSIVIEPKSKRTCGGETSAVG